MSYFNFERSWWDTRERPNVLLLHYADLKADLAGEMRRIADFLNMEIGEKIWPSLVEAAGFEAMRRDGDAVLGKAAQQFRGEGQTFFNKGENERWRGIFRDADLALYERKAALAFTPECAAWLANGRFSCPAGDPVASV